MFVRPYAKSEAPTSMKTMEYIVSAVVHGRMYKPIVAMTTMAW